MQTTYVRYFVDDKKYPKRLTILLNPIPEDWALDYSPLTRIATRLLHFGIIDADELSRNRIDILLRGAGWGHVSRVLMVLRRVLEECFDSEMECVDD